MTISPGQNIRMAIAQVGTHRFRSLLTVLGIVIGITTVVTVASLLTGPKNRATSAMAPRNTPNGIS